MQLYNTLSRRKEAFKPLTPGKVGFYACGVTVYDDCHLGHARSGVVFEVLVRYLRLQGLTVNWVRNFTDIDDKIIRRAQETGTSWQAVAERYIASFRQDTAALGLPPAQWEPRATDHLPQIVALIRRLEERGFAYLGAADVYFRVRRFPGYGQLSGQNPDDMRAGARIEVDPHKEDPLDFVLWKSSKPGEPAWPSPWGPGRPGWHIECSAMSMYYLGETFDLHGGGQDLIFPHHENELAQSEAATGQPLARYWLHHGLLTLNQEKMSKSLGNFFTIKEVLARFPAEVLRFFLINGHYRSPLDFSDAALADAEAALLRLYSTLARLREALRPHDEGVRMSPAIPEPNIFEFPSVARLASLQSRFEAAMDDDLNTAQALGYLFDAVRLINRLMEESSDHPGYFTVLREADHSLANLGRVLNLLQDDPAEMVRTLRQKAVDLKIAPEEIARLIDERILARNRKDWARADAIRKTLAEMEIVLEDTPQGTVWRVKS
ncbi:MAG: cysteine--tRNA ligase [Desulfobaccales bacterium]|jgi:cysteinyl-tRNA synthetase